MARNKDFKRLVRELMQLTGERYTTARAALRKPGPDEPRRLVLLLADPLRANGAQERLEALLADVLRPAALEGLKHTSWRVRRRCCQLLDDLALTDETLTALNERLTDEHPGVRQAALHSLVCEACKPEKCDVDVPAIAESMLSDPSERVRRAAVGSLRRYDGESIVALLQRIAEEDRSQRVRDVANELLRDKARRRAAADAWGSLDDRLRDKTAKHAGKWVAIAGGRVVAADRFGGQIRRDLKGTGHTDASLVWVPPEAEWRR
jgi:HEAT repeat protein